MTVTFFLLLVALWFLSPWAIAGFVVVIVIWRFLARRKGSSRWWYYSTILCNRGVFPSWLHGFITGYR